MEKKPNENGIWYGLDVVVDAAHKQMLADIKECEPQRASVWRDIAETVRQAIVAQLLDAIEHGEAERAKQIAKALGGWGVL